MASPENTSSPSAPRPRFKICIVATVSILVIAGAVLGGLCGSGLCNNDDGGDTAATAVANIDGDDVASDALTDDAKPILTDSPMMTSSEQQTMRPTLRPTLSLYNEIDEEIPEEVLPSSDNASIEKEPNVNVPIDQVQTTMSSTFTVLEQVQHDPTSFT